MSYFNSHPDCDKLGKVRAIAEITILKHCETRWLSLTRALKRTLDMWEPLVSYFNSHPDCDKLGKVRAIAEIINNPFTKVWIQFLTNVLVIFDKYNTLFQTTKTSTLHKIHAESERLLKTVLSFFVKPEVIRRTRDLASIKYLDSSVHLPDSDIYVGDGTTALLLHLQENEGQPVDAFYNRVKQFYQSFITKLLDKFDFKSDLFKTLKLLDPQHCQDLPLDVFDKLADLLPLSFDKAAVNLEF